jgi:hypothetical protein
MPAVTAEVTSMEVVVLLFNAARMLLTSTVEVAAVELAKSELRLELLLIAATLFPGRNHRVNAKAGSLHSKAGETAAIESTRERSS